MVLKKYDVLFIDDEVITGFGRTGNPFAAQTFDLQPATISLAKSLTSAYLPVERGHDPRVHLSGGCRGE